MLKGPAFDKKAEIEWISTDSLSVVWQQSQRSLDERFAKNIADNFDPEMFGTLAVTLPNGKGIYHLIDGQHRKRGVEIAFGKGQKVPCQIFQTTDPRRAAELFDEINSNRKTQQPLDFFKVRVTAGLPDYVHIAKIVRDNGYYVGRKGDKCVSCVGALLAVYRAYGPETLDATLKVIQAAWGMDHNAVVASIVRGFGMFMSEFRTKANWQRLHESVAKRFTPGRFLGAAKAGRELAGGSVALAVRDLLVQTYNKGLPKAKVLKPKQEEEPEHHARAVDVSYVPAPSPR